ncbi:MAG: response regulator transcription factor [Cyanophyceae cyanobacterium]
MRILLVEDDIPLAEALAEALSDQQYVVDTIHDGEAAWSQLQILDYDLIVLDVMLPKLNGISLCQRLRQAEYAMPVLIITARDTSTDKVLGLDAGADDYVVKPIDLPELLARIRALLRRGTIAASPVLEWKGLKLNPSTREVTYSNQDLNLTPKEHSILELFLRNEQRVLSRNYIIEHIWSLDDPPQEDSIKAHIKSLRHKLKESGASPDLIETVYGVGYRLKG